MDARAQHVQGFDSVPSAKRTDPVISERVEILLIGRDPGVHVYTDEVLKHAGFRVRVITPMEAWSVAKGELPQDGLVVFGSTLEPGDVTEIGRELRLRYPKAKLLLMLGPDPVRVDASIFDVVVDSLDGPSALIQGIRRLLGGAGSGSIQPSGAGGSGQRGFECRTA